MLSRTVIHISEICSRAGIALSVVLLVYIVIHIILEIILRNFFASSTNSMGEYVGYATGAMAFLAMGHTFMSRKHVRVSLLRRFLSGKAAIVVELVCIALTFAMFAFMARYVWLILARDFARGSVSPTLMATPTWYIAAAIFAGLVIFLIQLVASTIDTVINGVPEEHIEGE
ncbi:TRAP-type mannitol/chloroaromatic compound transport system, small permease component [Paracoccus halophilus]|uniref:TRAP transporter small permease protein n=1 Tax=Paracoccus halophilus TaxID=376733 RepID=A0A1I0U8X7_9RHOB|nr:TRAP transporter small permease [Paracoccus halophilus]SFA60549.1 TRAP-type mannitol/chloroaromatic compound transport system, small permease component [Paracoccus halophilus]